LTNVRTSTITNKNVSTKLNFNNVNEYRKPKIAAGNNNVKQRLSTMKNARGYRSKSCHSHFTNLTTTTTTTATIKNLTNSTTNDLKKLLEKKLNTNNQQKPATALIKPFKKRSTSQFTRSNTRKEKEDLLFKKGKKFSFLDSKFRDEFFFTNLCYLFLKDKFIQENVHKRKITREIVMEKLLTLIEMPIIEPLLDIDYTNDMQCSNEVDNSLVEILNESYDFSKCEM
jgi:hypothetical protein